MARAFYSLASASGALEELDLALVLACGFERGEGAQVLPLARLRVLLPRVEAVLAGLELPDHDAASTPGLWCSTSARSGIVVNAPTARRVQPTAFFGLLSSRSPSSSAIPAPKAARVPATSPSSGREMVLVIIATSLLSLRARSGRGSRAHCEEGQEACQPSLPVRLVGEL